jgi:hypothetical protein
MLRPRYLYRVSQRILPKLCNSTMITYVYIHTPASSRSRDCDPPPPTSHCVTFFLWCHCVSKYDREPSSLQTVCQGWRYESVSKSFRTSRLERELQMVQLSATRCSCIAILWVSLVSFTSISLYVASQRVFIVVYFVIASVRKLLDTNT